MHSPLKMSELTDGRGNKTSAIIHKRREIMEDSKLRIYGVKENYIKYLSQYQNHIYEHKGEFGRKYLGVVLEINGFKYFAPMSSFKPKHKSMHDSTNFIKIKDYAVININNMIPVPKSQIEVIDINKEKNKSYKFLLQAESREINKQRVRIRKNARIVYNHKKSNGNSTALSRITNDFDLLERLCRDFIE
jgi:protein AbiQ